MNRFLSNSQLFTSVACTIVQHGLDPEIKPFHIFQPNRPKTRPVTGNKVRSARTT
jgi:CRISPR/Cas system-associated endonuclease Cas1